MDISMYMTSCTVVTDPQVVKAGNSNKTIFRIAVDHSKEKTSFFDCESWNKTGEAMAKHIKKGKHINIIGEVRNDPFLDKETGKNRNKIYIKVEKFAFIDSAMNKTQSKSNIEVVKKNNSEDNCEL